MKVAFNPTPTPKPIPWHTHALAGVLLLAYLFLAVRSTWNDSCTFDEMAHITAGLSYWQTGDYRLNPENGLLPQRWAALPLHLQGKTIDPQYGNGYWWQASDVWRLGKDLFLREGSHPERILRPSRFMIALLGTALGAVIYLWSIHLFGPVGGLLSLLLYVTNPAMLAAGSLVTSDMAATLFFLLAVSTLWTVMHRLTPMMLLACTLSIAGLVLSKGSGMLIVPMAVLMLGIRLAMKQPLEIRYRRQMPVHVLGRVGVVMWLLGAAASCAIGVYLMVWLAYGARFGARAPSSSPNFRFFLGDWDAILKSAGGVGRVVNLFRENHLLPEAYLFGIAAVQAFSKRIAFLDGQWSLSGWPWFFPLTVLHKTPVVLFVCLGLSVAVAIHLLRTRAAIPGVGAAPSATRAQWNLYGRHALRWAYRTTPLWVLFAAFWLAVLPSQLNIGHRHVLPTYPTLLILAGAAGLWWSAARRIGRTLVLGLVMVAIVELVTVYPHCLSFFNVIAGGPSQGYRRLVDSSLDWGQDLSRLAVWLEQNAPDGPQRPPVYISYFGSGLPESYGIQANILPSGGWDILPRVPPPWQPGIYCISATMLQCVYSIPAGPWTSEREIQYPGLRAWSEQFAAQIAPLPWEQQKPLLNQSADRLRLVEGFRHVRMCHFLRQREPDARVGYSILVYYLSAQDLYQIEHGPAGPLPSWQDAVRGATRSP